MNVTVIMGSDKDLSFCNKIKDTLSEYGIEGNLLIASAHKAVHFLLDSMRKIEEENEDVVYITVAGMSNALSGVVDSNTTKPVIACPPPGTEIDVWSSLRMPSSVCPGVVLSPTNAALLAVKILGLKEKSLSNSIDNLHKRNEQKIINSNA